MDKEGNEQIVSEADSDFFENVHHLQKINRATFQLQQVDDAAAEGYELEFIDVKTKKSYTVTQLEQLEEMGVP